MKLTEAEDAAAFGQKGIQKKLKAQTFSIYFSNAILWHFYMEKTPHIFTMTLGFVMQFMQ